VNQIFEIDSTVPEFEQESKRIFFSGDTQKHISQLSASIVSENYVILGNPFSACRLCWKPKPEEKVETEKQTPEK